MTFTKAELIASLIEKLGFKRQPAKEFIDIFFETITERLSQGEPVKLSLIGNFSLRNKAARPGRNPKTQEPMPVSARRVVTFRASQKLKQNIVLHDKEHQRTFTKDSRDPESMVEALS